MLATNPGFTCKKYILFVDSPLRHWVRNEDICPRFTCSVPFGGSRWENHSNLFVASTDGRWQNGTLRPQSRRSHLKSLVFINKVIIAFFSPLHLFSILMDLKLSIWKSKLFCSAHKTWLVKKHLEVKTTQKFSSIHNSALNLPNSLTILKWKFKFGEWMVFGRVFLLCQ